MLPFTPTSSEHIQRGTVYVITKTPGAVHLQDTQLLLTQWEAFFHTLGGDSESYGSSFSY